MFTSLCDLLAKFFLSTFTVLDTLGNGPNYILTVLGIAVLIYWLRYVTVLAKDEK